MVNTYFDVINLFVAMVSDVIIEFYLLLDPLNFYVNDKKYVSITNIKILIHFLKKEVTF